MTTAYPGVTKAWHYHKKQTDHFICVKGMMKVVLYDPREGFADARRDQRVFHRRARDAADRDPAMVYHGFKCVSDAEAMVINYTTECYNYLDPDEYRTRPAQGSDSL